MGTYKNRREGERTKEMVGLVQVQSPASPKATVEQCPGVNKIKQGKIRQDKEIWMMSGNSANFLAVYFLLDQFIMFSVPMIYTQYLVSAQFL